MVKVYGFDQQNYAETLLPITVFRMPCNVPSVWIADNHTSWHKWDEIPMVQRSKGFQKQAYTALRCNETTPT